MIIDTGHYIKGSTLNGDEIILGRDRKGYRTKPACEFKPAEVEKPKFMVDVIGMKNADNLSALDIAIYEYLIAYAREDGIEKEAHSVVLSKLMAFAGIRDASRLDDSIDRIMSVAMKYRVLDAETRTKVWTHLLTRFAISTPLENKRMAKKITSDSVLTYSLPALVVHQIMISRSYGWIDLSVFPKFKSKYAGRIYPKLAVMAGYDRLARHPWKPMPNELAEMIGFIQADERLHKGSFDRVLRAAIDDIRANVFDFIFDVDFPKSKKELFAFYVSDRAEYLYAQKAIQMDAATIQKINDKSQSPLRVCDHPELVWFAQAYTYLKKYATWMKQGKAYMRSPAYLSDQWRLNIAAAKVNPDIQFGLKSGRDLMSLVSKGDIKSAFEMWIVHCVAPEPWLSVDAVTLVPSYSQPEPTKTVAWVESELHYDQGDNDDDEDLRIGDDYGDLSDKIYEPEF